MGREGSESAHTDAGGLLLNVFVVGDDLHHALPNVGRYVTPRLLNDTHDHIDVPRVAHSKLLSEDGDLDDKILSDLMLRDRKVVNQFTNYLTRVALIAHDVQQIKSLATDTNVGILEGVDNRDLVLLYVLVEHLSAEGQTGHQLEPDVAEVGVFRVCDIPAQDVCRVVEQLPVTVPVDNSVDRLSQYRVARIRTCGGGTLLASLLVLEHPLTAGNDFRQHGGHLIPERAHRGHRIDLQYTECLHLHPRGGHTIINVLLCRLLLHRDLRQQPDALRDRTGKLEGELGNESENERQRCIDDAQVHPPKLLDDGEGDFLRIDSLGRTTVQTEQGEQGLLLHHAARLTREGDLRNVVHHRIREVLTSYVGHGGEGEALGEFLVSRQVLLHGLGHDRHQLMPLIEEDGDGEVPDMLLGVLVSRQQLNALHVPEIDLVAQHEDVQQLANVFLLVVPLQCLLLLELLSNVVKFLVDSLLFRLLRLRCRLAQIGDKRVQSPHLHFIEIYSPRN
eukprot:Hpha_TRINITY_DN16867_c2_g1::TRINITY_DN16867_c2_g1_i3::g.149171::m.149171